MSWREGKDRREAAEPTRARQRLGGGGWMCREERRGCWGAWCLGAGLLPLVGISKAA